MSYSAGNGDLGPHKHHAHHYGPTSNLFSKICEMASRLVDDARQSAEWQMRRLDGAPCMAVSVVVVVRLNLVNVGQLWEMPPGSLRNCLWQSVVVTLLLCSSLQLAKSLVLLGMPMCEWRWRYIYIIWAWSSRSCSTIVYNNQSFKCCSHHQLWGILIA